MSLDKRIEKLEEQQPAFDIAARIIAARKVPHTRPSASRIAELEESAKRGSTLARRILGGYRRVGLL